MAATLETVVGEIQRHPEGRARARLHEAARVAHDRPALAQGLDRPEGGRRQAGRRHLPRAPGAADGLRRRSPSTSRCSKTGCGATGPRSCSTRTASSIAGTGRAGAQGHAPHGRESARQRRPAAARICACRISATTPSMCRSPATVDRRSHARAGQLPARRHEAEQRRAQLPRLRARTKPLRTAWTRCSR